MNNIKPQWIVGAFIVSLLWMTEMSNRPDDIPEYSEAMQQRHTSGKSVPVGRISKNNALDSSNRAAPTISAVRNSALQATANPVRNYTSVESNLVMAQEQPFSKPLLQPNTQKPANTFSQKALQTQARLSEY